MTSKSRQRDHRIIRRLRVLAPLLAGIVVLAACGSGSSSSSSGGTAAGASTGTTASSKPSYCVDVRKLEESVKALPSTNVVKNGTNAIKAQVAQVQSNATAAVNAVKSEFAPEAAAVESSVNALSATVKQLASSPSAAQLKQLPVEASAVSKAVKNFASATAPKCG